LYVEHPLLYREALEYREYQIKIASESTKNNTLVILPTALGKTAIAIITAAEMLYNYHSKNVLVMAPTRPLVLQHLSSFSKSIRLPAEYFVSLTGETPSSLRKIIWKSNSRLIFATPQVVWNDIANNYLSLNEYSLVVFDECHRAVEDYPYAKIAKHYVETCNYPIILALTASVSHDVKKAIDMVKNLFIEKIFFLDENDPLVRAYIKPVEIEWKVLDLPDEYVAVSSALKNMLRERISWLRGMKLIEGSSPKKKELIELSKKLEREINSKNKPGYIFASISKINQAILLYHMIELIETQGGESLKNFIESLKDGSTTRRRLFNEIKERGINSMLNTLPEHPKLNSVIQIVRENLAGDETRIIIFTQYRDTAARIASKLNDAGIPSSRFVGQSNREEDAGMNQDEQQRIIELFRKGEYKVLVATSVAEEGLDIPEVKLVIFYEPIPSAIRYIQRRGRTGRRNPGRVIILAADKTNDVAYFRASQLRLSRVRKVIEIISSNLTKIERQKMSEVKQLSERELNILHSHSGINREEYSIIKEEHERKKELEKVIGNAAAEAYKTVLNQGGFYEKGKLIERLSELGFPEHVAAAAIEKIEKEFHKAKGHLEIKPIEAEGLRARRIRVEKVLQGYCIVTVDGEFEAVIISEDYQGPRYLIKKGKEFLALCQTYDDNETHIRVRQVLREL
jgi:ERCC4-related helicase